MQNWKILYDFFFFFLEGSFLKDDVRKKGYDLHHIFWKNNLNLPVRMHFAIVGFTFDQCYCNVRTLTKKVYLSDEIHGLLTSKYLVTYLTKVPFVVNLFVLPQYFFRVLMPSLVLLLQSCSIMEDDLPALLFRYLIMWIFACCTIFRLDGIFFLTFSYINLMNGAS